VLGVSGTTRWQLRIDGALNLRDVGGLPCRAGGSTRHGVLLRSGSLRLLTDTDADALVTVLDVGTVVDLRTARELAADGPSVLARAGVATVHLPLLREDRPALPESGDPLDPPTALRRTYQDYLDEGGHHIATAARVVAGSDRTVLVHCAAGKDRTGVTVAMLLDAVGVERAAVIADYTATNDVIEQVVRALAAAHGHTREIEGVEMEAHRARPAVLGDLLDGVDDEHGGAAQWLRAHGVTDAELAALRHRLVRTPAPRVDGARVDGARVDGARVDGAAVTALPRTSGRTPSSPTSH
jgi:protein tyrosine/serine phosphatase